jgi:hypothetical protein
MNPFLALGIDFVLIISICIFHAEREKLNRAPVSKTFHVFWFLFWAAISALLCYLVKSWWLVLTFSTLRGFVYNQLLNELRHEPFFYIHGEGNNNPNPAITDNILIWLNSKWSYSYFVLWLIDIGLFTFSIFRL